MSKFSNFSIFFPKDHPDLVKEMGHHFYDEKPFTETFFCVFNQKLDYENLNILLNRIYQIQSSIQYSEYGPYFVGYTQAYPIVYGYIKETGELILYFTGSNPKYGFTYKGQSFSGNEIMALIQGETNVN